VGGRSVASTRVTAASTSTSLAPRLRVISKPTTGAPFSSAALRRSATVSVTVATWSSRTRGRRTAGSPAAPSSAADCTVAMVRTACSAPPRSLRPPAASCCTWRSWRDTSAAVAPSASRRAGSSATCTSRVTPPTRPPRPRRSPLSRALVMSLSTNQLSASSSMRDEATV
jgi:hypothetical protein